MIGTLITGFYVIEVGSPDRRSPVFRTRAAARHWLASKCEACAEDRGSDPDFCDACVTLMREARAKQD